jgi:hypothetical protein
LTDIIKYGFPTIAIVISILSYLKSRKSDGIRDRLLVVEEELKQYALEEKKKEIEDSRKACIEARIVSIGNHNYKLKVWNSGKAKACNVDYKVPEKLKGMFFREKTPFEYLEAGKNFEEHVIVSMGSPSKVRITTLWEDEYGESCTKEQIVQVY